MINQNILFKRTIILLFSVFALLLACQSKDVYEVNAIKVRNNWGYCILKNNKIIIKQSTIPSYSKSIQFKSKEDALKIGYEVANRIKNKLSPTVTKKDLILLKIKT